MAERESPNLEDTAKLAVVQERRASPPSQEAAAPAPQATVPVRNVPLYLLVIFAAIALLYWAKVVFIPLVLGFIVSYALAPVVDRLQKLGIPRGVSAAVLLLVIVLGIGAATFSLRDEAVDLIESLPEAVEKMQAAAREEFADSRKTIEKMQKAAQEIERATESRAADTPPSGVRQVQVVKPKLDIRQYLATTVTNAMAISGLALIVVLLAYFLLASGDSFRRKWVQLSGPTLARRKVTIQVMDEIASQVQLYLGVQVLTSAIVGVASGLAFWAIGLDNAAVWGIAAGVLNLVPYLGAIVTTAGTALVAFFQFGTVEMALAVAAISLVINSIEGYWLTPWLSGRASRMNNVVVFSGLLFWGWLWGGWGVVLGLPIMMVVKAVCDHVEHLKPIGEFMGE
jgi:predicted PurR-regulated permease PerM